MTKAPDLNYYEREENLFLRGDSSVVQVPNNTITSLLKFRSPNEPSVLHFTLFVDNSIGEKGDIFVIAFKLNGKIVQKYGWIAEAAGEKVNPIYFSYIFDAFSDFEIEVKFTSPLGVPSRNVNATCYGQSLRAGVSLG